MRNGGLKVQILGSGTSAGVPMIGCHCEVCESTDPRDKRSRCSIAVHYDGHSILVDTTPELRLQACAAKLDRIDAVVFTHAHADHIFGLDDVRRYNTILNAPLPIYGTAETLSILQTAYSYAFTAAEKVPGALYRPELVPTIIGETAFELCGRMWQPVPLIHGRAKVMGFRIGNFAYCTDCSAIVPSSLALLQNLDVLIIDALRPRPHPTHLSFEQAISMIDAIKPKRAFFTHLSHDVKHADIEKTLPPHIGVLYDGLVIETV